MQFEDYGKFLKDGFAKELYLHKTTFIHEMKFKTLRILKINVNKINFKID